MRVALDTSGVVRLLVADDEPRALAARRILQEADQIVGGDFADGCVLRAVAQARSHTFLTFDKSFVALSRDAASLLEA